MKLGFDPTQHKPIRYQSSQDPPKQIPKPKYINKDIYVKSVNDKKTFNISWMVIGVNQSISKSHLYPLYHPSPPLSLSLSLWNQSPKSNEDHDCPSICMWDMFVKLDLLCLWLLLVVVVVGNRQWWRQVSADNGFAGFCFDCWVGLNRWLWVWISRLL